MKNAKNIEAVTFELTNKCNLRCVTCNIWKEKPKRQLSLKTISKVLGHCQLPVSVALTGGEPFLHSNFDEIYKYLFKLFLQKKVREINVATNGYSPVLLDFLKINPAFLTPLSFSISIDGLNQNHSEQRGKTDSFKKTLAMIIKLRKLGLPVAVKFVITRINYIDLYRVYCLSKKLGCSFYPKFYERLNHYYHRVKEFHNLELTEKSMHQVALTLKKIREEEEKTNKRSLLVSSLVVLEEFARKKTYRPFLKCLTPSRSIFITYQSNIYTCINQQKISNIAKWPEDFDSRVTKDIEQRGLSGKCPKCLSYHGYLREFNFR